MPYQFLMVMVAVLFGIAACDDSSPAVSRAEHQGLVVEFKSVCKDEALWLDATIYNSSAKPIRIESGSLPWEFDSLGTHFNVESEGKALVRNAFFPPIGRPGPFNLAPAARQSGLTPIGFLFPEMKELLTKQQVSVHWKYSDELEGMLVIKRDPCSR
jgi:hypothetical protein